MVAVLSWRQLGLWFAATSIFITFQILQQIYPALDHASYSSFVTLISISIIFPAIRQSDADITKKKIDIVDAALWPTFAVGLFYLSGGFGRVELGSLKMWLALAAVLISLGYNALALLLGQNSR